MNEIYAKSILYAYPCLEALIEQIDDLVLGLAIASMDNYKSCLTQCNAIISLTEQKDDVIQLKLVCDDIFSKGFTPYEYDCLDYRYFRKQPKEYYETFDVFSRKYFRNQIHIVKKFARKLKYRGITDEWFENTLLKIDFFKELVHRVETRKEPSFERAEFVEGRVYHYDEDFEEEKLSA